MHFSEPSFSYITKERKEKLGQQHALLSLTLNEEKSYTGNAK